MEYRGERQDGIYLDRSMTYNDFVLRVCGKMSIDVVGLTFSYTLPFDLYAFQPLKNDKNLTKSLVSSVSIGSLIGRLSFPYISYSTNVLINYYCKTC